MNTPWTESPFFYQILEEKKLSPEWVEMARTFHEKGYLILKNAAPGELVDRVLEDIAPLFPEKINESPLRQQDLWSKYDSVKLLAMLPKVLETLRFLYEKEPVPFQTLNFKFGSQQQLHSDTIHFSSIPARYMCGVWVALEPTDEKNGPLLYCPGANRLPEYFYSDIGIPADYPGAGDGVEKGDGYKSYDKYEDFIASLVDAKKFTINELHVEKGDVLIWASNLIHGGKAVLDPSRTRWSQVIHYYFENSVYYTPMWSNMHTGELFLRNIRHVGTGNEVPNKLDNKTVNALYTGKSRHLLYETFAPGLFKTLTWKQVWINVKDKIKERF